MGIWYVVLSPFTIAHIHADRQQYLIVCADVYCMSIFYAARQMIKLCSRSIAAAAQKPII